MVLKFSDLQAIALKDEPKQDQPKLTLAGMTFDIDTFMSRHFPGVQPVPYQDGRKWILQTCPWNPEHTNAAAFVIQFGNGALSAGCRHNGCANNDWRLLRTMYEPKREPIQQAHKPSPIIIPLKSKVAGDLNEHMEQVIRGEIINTPWEGAPALTYFAKCLIPGTITCLCGSSGSTKSFFISQQCLGWLEVGTPFAVYHLEEDKVFHQHRALAQLSGNSNVTHDEWVRNNPDTTRGLLKKHKAAIAALGEKIWDAPTSDVNLTDVIVWIRDRVNDGARIVVVDPITAADSGREPWAADRRFILEAKRIMRESGASLVLVTHPRTDAKQNAGTMDNMAGGRAYNRFTQAILWMHAMDAEPRTVERYVFGLKEFNQVTVNRTLRICKSRSGSGNGLSIAYYFNPATLTFSECGILSEEKE
jgi:KaiC/GvpD/RAD55 family RecA-like ATPase